MNIKDAAFTVSEKSINIILFALPYGSRSGNYKIREGVAFTSSSCRNEHDYWE